MNMTRGKRAAYEKQKVFSNLLKAFIFVKCKVIGEANFEYEQKLDGKMEIN